MTGNLNFSLWNQPSMLGGQGRDAEWTGKKTWSYGTKYVGEWKNGKEWNITLYKNNGKIIGRYVVGLKE
jgi:hypothetical protein